VAKAENIKKYGVRPMAYLIFWTVLLVFFAIVNSLTLDSHSVNAARIKLLQQEIESEKRSKIELENELKFNETDAFIEKIAREQLGLIKSDEILFIADSK